MKIYTINVDFTQPKDIRIVLPTAESIGIKLTGSKGWRNNRYAYLDGRSVYGSSAFYTFDNTDTSKTFVINKPVDGNLIVLNSSSSGGLKIKFNLYIEVADETVTSQADITVSETLDASNNPVSAKGIAETFAAMGYAFGATYAYYYWDGSKMTWKVESPASKHLGNIPDTATKLLIGKDVILDEGKWGTPFDQPPASLYYIWFEAGRTLDVPNLIGTKSWGSMSEISIPTTVEVFETGNMPNGAKLIIRGGYEGPHLSEWTPNKIRLNENAVVTVDTASMASDMYNAIGEGNSGYKIEYPAKTTYTP